ncbi:hypothetical protein GWI33_017185 [Rhynchophorus ferrugineus]|uniref:Uncharacterized protein n=1 Tax=Rhynchophorus ferrugineus TaxID=354439 RepID=A0A834HX78_RHYFE|nr:hypothetical protein GWI33_017185 [Rhynchophorus ferrugineus]
MSLEFNGYSYKFLYSINDEKHVYICIDGSCRVKIIVSGKPEAILKRIGRHKHQDKKPNQALQHILEDCQKTNFLGPDPEVNLRKLKRYVKTERTKYNIQRRLRQTVLRKSFLKSVWSRAVDFYKSNREMAKKIYKWKKLLKPSSIKKTVFKAVTFISIFT